MTFKIKETVRLLPTTQMTRDLLRKNPHDNYVIDSKSKSGQLVLWNTRTNETITVYEENVKKTTPRQTFWITKTPKELAGLIDRMNYQRTHHKFIIFDQSSKGSGKTSRAIQMACAMYKIDPSKLELKEFKIHEPTGKFIAKYIKLKKERMPKLEHEIKHINRFELRIGNATYHADSQKDAEERLKIIKKQKQDKWKKEHTDEFETIRINKEAVRQVGRYIELLQQRLHRELKKPRTNYDYEESEEECKVREIKREQTKQIKKELEDILSGKREVDWSQSWTDDSSSFFMTTVKRNSR